MNDYVLEPCCAPPARGDRRCGSGWASSSSEWVAGSWGRPSRRAATRADLPDAAATVPRRTGNHAQRDRGRGFWWTR
jgi:hypothetical protein